MNRCTLSLIAALAAPAIASAGDCTPAWQYDIGTPGVAGYAGAFAAWDDGTGESLYAAGSFTSADGNPASNVARWDGSAWSALDSSVFASFCNTVMPYDGRLYVGGAFNGVGGIPGTSTIASWDGTGWASVGGGITSTVPSVWSMAVYDGKLIVGGNYLEFGGVADTNYVAAWDGTEWTAVGGGLGGQPGLANALCMTVYNGDLYVAGRFDSAGGATVSQIAKWDGSTWSDVGGGITGTQVLGMGVYNGDLYVTGNFTDAGGVPARGVAKWDGFNWSAVGSGFAGNLYDAIAYDDGSGEALYVVGTFTASLAGTPMSKIARFNGTTWEAVGGGLDAGNAFGLGVWNDGAGESLYVGGSFDFANGIACMGAAQWRGCAVSACPADLDGSGAVDSTDLAILLAAWGGPGADFNGSGSTDSADLAIMLAAWGDCPL